MKHAWFVTMTLAGALAACGDNGAGFAYSASVGWDKTATPEITMLQVDGFAVQSGFIVTNTYVSYDNAQEDTHTVDITSTVTTDPAQTHFTFGPGVCARKGVVDIVEEDETLLLRHATIAGAPNPSEPIRLQDGAFHCLDANGSDTAPAE